VQPKKRQELLIYETNMSNLGLRPTEAVVVQDLIQSQGPSREQQLNEFL